MAADLPALVRKAGYYTGFIGKFGVQYYTFRGQAAQKFDFWRGHDGWTRFFPKDSKSPSCTPYHEAEQDVITFIMGECMAEFFDSLPKDKPFCLSVSFNVPHGSQTTSMYPDSPDGRRMIRPANENPKLRAAPSTTRCTETSTSGFPTKPPLIRTDSSRNSWTRTRVGGHRPTRTITPVPPVWSITSATTKRSRGSTT